MTTAVTNEVDLDAAIEALLANPEAAAKIQAVLMPRNKGGRPKGSKNKGPNKLEETIMALNAKRATMTPEQLERSELRVSRLLTKQWAWKSRAARNVMIEGGVSKQEMDVVVAYLRSEDRDGMSRTAKMAKDDSPTIGAGYDDPMVEDKPTKKELAGEVKRDRLVKRRRSVGYTTIPEEIVETSLEVVAEPVMLWGYEVTRAVQEEIGFEPIRARSSKRSWLVPPKATEEFQIGKRTVVGAGSGENGRAMPWDWSPTIGECHRIDVGQDRVEGPQYEPDEHGDQVERLDGLRVVSVAHAEFDVWWLRLRKATAIVAGTSMEGNNHARFIHIDAVCIRPEQAADEIWPTAGLAVKHKDVAIVPAEKHRATPRERAVTTIVRKGVVCAMGRVMLWRRRFVADEMSRDPGEKLAGPHETRWRKADWREATKAIALKVLAGKLDFEKGIKAVKKAKRFLKPEGMLPEPQLEADGVEAGVNANQIRLLTLWEASGRPLPVLQPVTEGFLRPCPPRAVSVVLDVAQVGWRDYLATGVGSLVWSEVGEPLRGSEAWWDRQFAKKDSQPEVKERVRKPDRMPGWQVLPILSPPCGYMKFLDASRS